MAHGASPRIHLSHGYTSLIPKPGEEGPLGTLTVLSMVYRLWAGTRLWEVMRWQEPWVHPRAYGFRLARGAVDAATVTEVLPEQAGLKGWRMEGLSLDLPSALTSSRKRSCCGSPAS